MQITDHIHALRIPFEIPVAPGKRFERFVSSYLVIGPEICLIDSGVKNSYSVIFDYLMKLGRKPEDISLLILTHAHPDHIGSARAIKEATDCTVAAHPEALEWIEDVDQLFKERPVPGFHSLVGGSTRVDRYLQEGEIIDLGSISLKVINTPGHARGAISLYCKEEEVLFAGDAIPQSNDLPIYEDVVTSVESINRLKAIPSLKHLLASWTDPLSGNGAYKMMDNGLEYLQQIHAAIRKITADKRVEDPMELCARMVKVLGLPEIAVNSLTARSFAAHLTIIDREKLY